MAAVVGEIDDQDILDPQDLEQLYSWIDGAPLSRPKKHIARDFSDGVSVAEIVHFYMPRMVELHNYVNANSTAQKRINWNMLNRKVFVKLNIRLTDKTMDNIIDAKPGAIEQVLWDLRKKVIEMYPKSLSRSNTSNQLKGKTSSGYTDVKAGKKVSSNSVVAVSQSTRIPVKALNQPLNTVKKTTMGFASGVTTAVPKGQLDNVSYAAGLKDELTKYGNNLSSSNAGPKSESNNLDPSSAGTADTNANLNQDPSSLPPAHLIYKGHKMVPSMLLDIKNRQIRDLEVVVNGLQKKVNFLDNLVQLKDNRVEDLTRQLHSMKSRFQDIAQSSIAETN